MQRFRSYCSPSNHHARSLNVEVQQVSACVPTLIMSRGGPCVVGKPAAASFEETASSL